MKKQTIAIIGGSQEKTFKKVGDKFDCDILFHNGKTRNGAVKKDFKTIIQKSDCVIILLGACGHGTMNIVKKLCKEYNKPIVFQNGFGASLAIQKGADLLSKAA